ncbi:hypothetical protein HDV02_003314 [Globomyces sp. JEL0801]|nr:hypothetical protein HDV02_003314 [Globomyces sp. JEL0801]
MNLQQQKKAKKAFDEAESLFAQSKFSHALKYYLHAAELFHAVAHCRLITLYQNESARGRIGIQQEIVDPNHTPVSLTEWSLGFCFHRGIGVPKDLEHARKLYVSASNGGSLMADFYLAMMQMEGKGRPVNQEEAYAAYVRLAESNLAIAQFHVGQCLEHAIGTEKDWERAFYYYEKAAEQGHLDAIHNLEKSDIKAFEHYKKAVGQGLVGIAQSNLALCYLEGRGVEKNLKEAISLFENAAFENDSVALFMLASCYYEGEGVPKDLEKAIEYATLAANQHDQDALNFLGDCHRKGEGVPQSYEKAFGYYNTAATDTLEKPGDPTAKVNLGDCYRNRMGIPSKPKKKNENYDKTAFALYKNASEEELGLAFTRLGECFELGIGTAAAPHKSISHYRIAAEKYDCPEGMYHLGRCYEHGINIRSDVKKALHYYKLSADLKYKPAETAHHELSLKNSESAMSIGNETVQMSQLLLATVNKSIALDSNSAAEDPQSSAVPNSSSDQHIVSSPATSNAIQMDADSITVTAQVEENASVATETVNFQMTEDVETLAESQNGRTVDINDHAMSLASENANDDTIVTDSDNEDGFSDLFENDENLTEDNLENSIEIGFVAESTMDNSTVDAQVSEAISEVEREISSLVPAAAEPLSNIDTNEPKLKRRSNYVRGKKDRIHKKLKVSEDSEKTEEAVVAIDVDFEPTLVDFDMPDHEGSDSEWSDPDETVTVSQPNAMPESQIIVESSLEPELAQEKEVTAEHNCLIGDNDMAEKEPVENVDMVLDAEEIPDYAMDNIPEISPIVQEESVKKNESVVYSTPTKTAMPNIATTLPVTMHLDEEPGDMSMEEGEIIGDVEDEYMTPDKHNDSSIPRSPHKDHHTADRIGDEEDDSHRRLFDDQIMTPHVKDHTINLPETPKKNHHLEKNSKELLEEESNVCSVTKLKEPSQMRPFISTSFSSTNEVQTPHCSSPKYPTTPHKDYQQHTTIVDEVTSTPQVLLKETVPNPITPKNSHITQLDLESTPKPHIPFPINPFTSVSPFIKPPLVNVGSTVVTPLKPLSTVTFPQLSQTPAKVIALYRNSASKGDSGAQFLFGECLFNGDGIEQDKSQAIQLFTQAAEKGDSDAMYFLGICFLEGDTVEKDEQKSFQFLQNALKDPSALIPSRLADVHYRLGLFYFEGTAVTKSVNEAIDHFQKAADLDHPLASAQIATVIESSDPLKALAIYEKSASLGNIDAMYKVAMYYHQGQIVNQDLSKAYHYYQESCEHITDSKYQVSKFYLYHPEFKNLSKALGFLKELSNLKHPQATYHLAYTYEMGMGCSRNVELAFKYYKMSHELGCQFASISLARFYGLGLGTVKDSEKSSDLMMSLL